MQHCSEPPSITRSQGQVTAFKPTYQVLAMAPPRINATLLQILGNMAIVQLHNPQS
ncbi:hypothetical protein ACSZM9_21110 [Aeromonas hydrophila]|uniref:hypothetical protein n=1 Tax=Aeromonas hydrophila TaxID=644 RepID=UPI003EC7239E